MNPTKLNLIDKLFNLASLALVFLVPLFFLPLTTEFFEFNKLALITLVSLVMLALWGVKIITTRKFSLATTQIDLPLVLYAGTMILATIFSLNKETSIFGSAGRWFPSLAGFLAMLVYYYAVASNANKLQTAKVAIYTLLGSATISTLLTMLGFYNKPLVISGNYIFGVTGSVTNSVALAVTAAMIAVPLMFKETNTVKKYIAAAAITLNIAAAMILNVTIGWVLIVLGLVMLAALTPMSEVKKNRLVLNITGGFLTALFILTLLPATNKILVNKDYPKEVSLSLTTSWVVASSTIRDFPLLGTGPSTFGLNYTRYRPLGMNSTNEWGVRFDKPVDEILNSLGTNGIIGTAALLILGVAFLKFALNARLVTDNEGVTYALAMGIILMLAMPVMTYSTVLTTFMLFTFAALLAARVQGVVESNSLVRYVSLSFTSTTNETSLSSLGTVKKEYFQYIVALPVFALAVAGALLTYKVYEAEYYMRKGVVAAQTNSGGDAYKYTGMAINANPRRDTYQNVYAQINLAIANNLAKKQDMTDADKQTIQSLIAQAIRSTRISTEMLNPLNAANWEVRAGVYRSLIGAAQNADQWTINALNNAIQLDPTNPKLRLDLGGIYYAKEDYLSAGNQFRQAAILKSDYANAHYNFAEALIKLKDLKTAKTELEAAAGLVKVDSEDYKKVMAELETIKNAPEVAGAASNKPTIAPITENTGAPVQNTTVQEPINKATTTNQLENVKDVVTPVAQPKVTPTPVKETTQTVK